MRSMKLAGALVALTAGLLAGAQQASADIYIVRNANSNGLDSLRNRINDANNHPGHDTIGFRIPGAGPHTITPLNTPLPTITETVTIDGYSEPGTSPPAAGTNADLEVAINATNHSVGLDVAADDVTIRGLSIHTAGIGSGQPGDAVRINGNDNRVEGSFLGLEPNGVVAGNASDGVEIAGDGNVVGGTDEADRNVLAGNGFGGVSILGDDNRVRGNTVGTDPDATTDLGNDVGVWLFGLDNTVANNLISGNEVGVDVFSGTGNEVLDNLIGTNAAGDHELVDGFFGGETGVDVEVGASNSHIAGNVVGGSSSEGILLAGDANSVQGNRLGTDGVSDLNNMRGMKIHGDDNLVGGAGEGEGNLVSGNRIQGIEFRADPVTNDPSDDNTVEGNLIGTDPEGDAPLPNDSEGIEIIDANDNDFVGNVISGNGQEGVRIRVDDTATTDRNRFVGNSIGTDVSGTLDLGNGGDGVRIEEAADDNHVGTVSLADPGNTIAFNDANGVVVDTGSTDNTIVRNSMYSNTGLGIDLDDDGATLNDAGDADTGGNELINHPDVTAATTAAADWEIIDGVPNELVRVDVYACDGDEGRTFLGSANALTDGSGNASGSVTLTTSPAVGDLVTATVTQRLFAFPPVQNETSEFSPCLVAVS